MSFWRQEWGKSIVQTRRKTKSQHPASFIIRPHVRFRIVIPLHWLRAHAADTVQQAAQGVLQVVSFSYNLVPRVASVQPEFLQVFRERSERLQPSSAHALPYNQDSRLERVFYRLQSEAQTPV